MKETKMKFVQVLDMRCRIKAADHCLSQMEI